MTTDRQITNTTEVNHFKKSAKKAESQLSGFTGATGSRCAPKLKSFRDVKTDTGSLFLFGSALLVNRI